MSDDSAFETELNDLLGSLGTSSRTPESTSHSASVPTETLPMAPAAPDRSKERVLSQAEIDALLLSLLG